jgi:hypothetical protein
MAGVSVSDWIKNPTNGFADHFLVRSRRRVEGAPDRLVSPSSDFLLTERICFFIAHWKFSTGTEMMLTFDPRSIFQLAEEFHIAHTALITKFVAEHRDKSIGITNTIGPRVIEMGSTIDVQAFPALTSLALALELYFKCLITIEKGGFLPRHELDGFFNELSAQSQDKIRQYATELGNAEADNFNRLSQQRGLPTFPKFDFDTALDEAKNAFIRYRYAYEEGFDPKVQSGGLGPIIDGARRVILDLHPDWTRDRIARILGY